jgi:hypothetical protein
MAFFQKSVTDKHLSKLNEAEVKDAFEMLKKRFSVSIQKRIYTSSETSLQGEFIERFFGNVMGYIRFPEDDWNVKREQDSQVSNERADAVIAIDSDETKTLAVVELKSREYSLNCVI